MRPINRALRAAVRNQQIAASRLMQPELSALCVTNAQIELLLDQVEINQSGSALPGMPISLLPEERLAEEEVIQQSAAFSSALPLRLLEEGLGFTPFELEAVLLCAAPELDRAYERIFGFVLDDLNRRFPCVELLSTVTAGSLEEILERRRLLSSFGRLRRCGFLETLGDAPTEFRQELRLSPGVFDFLAGVETDVARLFRDRAEVSSSRHRALPAEVSQDQFHHLCDALRQGAVTTVGIWGPRQNGVEEFLFAVSDALERPLRRLFLSVSDQRSTDPAGALREQLRIACGLGAVLWLDSDKLSNAAHDKSHSDLSDLLAQSPVPVFLTGEEPWRPLALLRNGAYAEFELRESEYDSREKLWSLTLPELESSEVSDLASRFALSAADVQSISDIARTSARLHGNGQPGPVQDHLASACAIVTRPSSSRFATVLMPRRGPADLILPEHLHHQVVEVATFFKLHNRVDNEWGFGRLLSGPGMKALFTGEPGTGKTLAAEIIAGLLTLPLYKVDLARIVSKGVGETEKNLEAAFREAESSHAVLFFDEAEALFGKRGEVQHGTDRYANLEVSYLLQRLESSRGLVILASNVKDQIDLAFVRRFQVAIHFPKPSFGERLRIWKLAFPLAAPLEGDVDFDALAQLDMTGAAIVGTARTAALLAADSGAPRITMSHIVRSTARQFRREARVLTPVELGQYGALLQGAS